jgi:hypothetical protein
MTCLRIWANRCQEELSIKQYSHHLAPEKQSDKLHIYGWLIPDPISLQCQPSRPKLKSLGILPSCSFCCSPLGALHVSVSFELHNYCIRIPVFGRLEILKRPPMYFSILSDALWDRGGWATDNASAQASWISEAMSCPPFVAKWWIAVILSLELILQYSVNSRILQTRREARVYNRDSSRGNSGAIIASGHDWQWGIDTVKIQRLMLRAVKQGIALWLQRYVEIDDSLQRNGENFFWWAEGGGGQTFSL